jgi:DNA polymerase-1
VLRKLEKTFDPPYIAAVFESSTPTLRSQAFAEYKANRVETPPDLLDQIPHVRRILAAMRIPIVEYVG